MGGVALGGSCGTGRSHPAQGGGAMNCIQFYYVEVKWIGLDWTVWASVEAVKVGAVAQHRDWVL